MTQGGGCADVPASTPRACTSRGGSGAHSFGISLELQKCVQGVRGGEKQRSVIDSRAVSQRKYTVVTAVDRARSTGASQDREGRQGADEVYRILSTQLTKMRI